MPEPIADPPQLSVFDLFSIGIGPSSSHTVGPMRAAAAFARDLVNAAAGAPIDGIEVELFGSLAATGRGHNTFGAVLLGLEGHRPESIDPEFARTRVAEFDAGSPIALSGESAASVVFSQSEIRLHPLTVHERHPNELRFRGRWAGGELGETWYSVGGGFIEREGGAPSVATVAEVPHPFGSGAELLEICRREGLSIAQVVFANERAWASASDIRSRLLEIWSVMEGCIASGFRATGVLPGTLGVPRRAGDYAAQLMAQEKSGRGRSEIEWATAAAMAVNEENAAGGRIVTAPTNGAAGVLPAVLYYHLQFESVAALREQAIIDFLLVAGAIGSLYKRRASISGADVGCQGEVGSASSMAAGALAHVLGGTPSQVENAAEIGMEHNLGLTCDPIGGLVQIPCIERNGMAAVKAITAAKLALRGNGTHLVSLDQVIETMRQTGADMHDKYKETSRGGLAVNVPEC